VKFSVKSLIPSRIPILYLMLAVLTVISVVPLYFYSSMVVGTNRDRLKTNYSHAGRRHLAAAE